jgi:hypothetical protein
MALRLPIWSPMAQRNLGVSTWIDCDAVIMRAGANDIPDSKSHSLANLVTSHIYVARRIHLLLKRMIGYDYI